MKQLNYLVTDMKQIVLIFSIVMGMTMVGCHYTEETHDEYVSRLNQEHHQQIKAQADSLRSMVENGEITPGQYGKWTNARSLYEEAYGKEESDELFEPIHRAYLESFAEKVEPSVENRSHNESELF